MSNIKSCVISCIIAITISIGTVWYQDNLRWVISYFNPPKHYAAKSVCESMHDSGYFEWQKLNPGKAFFSSDLSKLDNDCIEFLQQ